METQEIRIEENGLKVVFEVRENGMVELKQFSTVNRTEIVNQEMNRLLIRLQRFSLQEKEAEICMAINII